jgi:hypothetical protein
MPDREKRRAGDGNRNRMTSLEGSVRLLRRVLADALLCKDFGGYRPSAKGTPGRNFGRKPDFLENSGDQWSLMSAATDFSRALSRSSSEFPGDLRIPR